MSKFYNQDIPDEINVVYGYRYSGKIYNENKKLEERIRELEEKNKTFEDYNKDLNNQLDKLEEILDKATKYIEDNVAVYGFGNKALPHWEFDDDNIQDLLKILKGEVNE